MLLLVVIIIGGMFLVKLLNDSNNKIKELEEKISFSNENNSSNKIEDVEVISVVEESYEFHKNMTIIGKDKNNNVIWRYTTLDSNIPTESVNKGCKLIETRNGKVYLCDYGKLYILDAKNGKVLAENKETNIGAAAVHVFDENNNLYTVSYLSSVNKLDSNAKLLKSTEEAWNNGFVWPKKMSINGNSLVIDYGDEGVITLNKDTLAVIETKKN